LSDTLRPAQTTRYFLRKKEASNKIIPVKSNYYLHNDTLSPSYLTVEDVHPLDKATTSVVALGLE